MVDETLIKTLIILLRTLEWHRKVMILVVLFLSLKKNTKIQFFNFFTVCFALNVLKSRKKVTLN